MLVMKLTGGPELACLTYPKKPNAFSFYIDDSAGQTVQGATSLATLFTLAWAFKQRMLSVAAHDPAIIEEQLANPPDTWRSPDELTDVLENDEQVNKDIQGGNE